MKPHFDCKSLRMGLSIYFFNRFGNPSKIYWTVSSIAPAVFVVNILHILYCTAYLCLVLNHCGMKLWTSTRFQLYIQLTFIFTLIRYLMNYLWFPHCMTIVCWIRRQHNLVKHFLINGHKFPETEHNIYIKTHSQTRSDKTWYHIRYVYIRNMKYFGMQYIPQNTCK